jgi:hypothetical protein
MPVTFKYDERSGIVLTTARGIISFEDLMSHMEAKAHMKLSGAAELFDARDITLDLSLAQMRQLAQETENLLGSQQLDKTAVVTNSAFIYGLARAYAAVSRQDKSQFEVFSDVQDAQGWILKYTRAVWREITKRDV